MNRKLFTNALIYRSKAGFVPGSFTVEDGRFSGIYFADEEIHGGEPEPAGNGLAPGVSVDLHGAYVIPGLVDIHIHGCAGTDFSDAASDGLRTMAAYLAGHGITSFLPTTMSLPEESLRSAIDSACSVLSEYADQSVPGRIDSVDNVSSFARIAGIRLEGPFLSARRKGSQKEDNLCQPDTAMFLRLYEASGSRIRIIDVAPELEGAIELIREVSALCTVSAGHTETDYDTALRAFEAGAAHITHLYNAMPPMLHRAPGLIGAGSEGDHVTAEIICDGIHVHPAAVRAAFKLFPGRLCLISDAVRCCGMPDGEYELGGQTVYMKQPVSRQACSGHAAYLADGTLAGSATDLWQCMRNAVSFGIDLCDAIDASTIVPARIIGADNEIGSIESGKLADFAVCNEELNLVSVYIGGEQVIY